LIQPFVIIYLGIREKKSVQTMAIAIASELFGIVTFRRRRQKRNERINRSLWKDTEVKDG